jgi:hypothetical protein
MAKKETAKQREKRLREEFREMNAGITEAELVPPDAYSEDVEAERKRADAAEALASEYMDHSVKLMRELVALKGPAKIPDAHKTKAMTPTEVARRLKYSTKKSEDDAGRKRVEREIEGGVLRAIRVRPRARKWWFDKREIPDA